MMELNLPAIHSAVQLWPSTLTSMLTKHMVKLLDKHLRQIIKWKFRPHVATYSPFPITVSGVG